MLPGKKYRPEDLIATAWRSWWIILGSLVLIGAGTFLYARFFLPDRYRSETVILVVPQQVPESYVRATVTSNIADRLQTIQQTIMSRTRLEGIIDQFKLYPVERRKLPMEDVVESMRTRDIDVQIVKGDAFRVAYSSDNPRTAMLVAERLASLFINESMQDRQVMATATSDFLQSQLDDARRQLVEQENRKGDYERGHAGELPSERQTNLQILQNLQMQVQALVESISRDIDRRAAIERSLADVAVEAQSAPASAVAPDEAVSSGTLTAAARLEIARKMLADLQLRYKDDHPEVRRWKSIVRDLEAKAQAESLEKPLSEGASGRPATAQDKRAAELRTEMANLELSLKAKQAEEKRERDLIAVYQARVGATPIREAQMAGLTRDYETLKHSYETLLTKQQDSKVAANLESRQIGELFKVIDPARYPERPSSPNRPLIELLGALAGLGVGLGLVVAREYHDRSMRTEDDAVLCLSLPVLALVPVMTTASERRAARRRRVLLSCTAAVVVLGGAAGALAWKLGWLSAYLAR